LGGRVTVSKWWPPAKAAALTGLGNGGMCGCKDFAPDGATDGARPSGRFNGRIGEEVKDFTASRFACGEAV
jgi:hypothetical protein